MTVRCCQEKEKKEDSSPSLPICCCLCKHDVLLIRISITGANTYLKVHANLYRYLVVEQLLL